MSPPVKLVFGGVLFQSGQLFSDPTAQQEAFSILHKAGIKSIDTARLYGDSETQIGLAKGHEDFIIDTKWPGGFAEGNAAKENIINDAKDSFNKLKIDKIDIFYIHAPDKSVPIEETLEGVNEVYKLGIFARFGLSNFGAEDVRKVYDICKNKGYVLPSVYQGNYSAVARKMETMLFPTLRELGMSFYAYSPIAGGFLVKRKEQITGGEGRFSEQVIGGLYGKLYNRPSYLGALDEWSKVAEKEGVSKAELAYRWIAFHSALKSSHGDAVIFGASSIKQIEQTSGYLKAGPLSDEAAQRIEEIWKSIEHEAPVDNFQIVSGAG
ncbi:aldehyde reductase [Delitschia confertaspora ATCC 74209]|uniref:Aldehyde reductase n=1 Tax=Delitschia confertaspora ATCC 74209 TaxID=1513339 RepID=A0A9P4JG98_9PLEO|nr:aldehyde reductase [Delitschia confertaspora ATCC 74209]